MRTALFILSVVAAAVSEAPYHLPRPGLNAPGINYQAHGHSHQSLQPIQYPQQNYVQNPGYQYQQPNIAPAFVQTGFLQPQFIQQPNVIYGSPLLRQPQQGYINGYPSQQQGFNQGYAQIGQSPLVYSNQQSSYSSYQADNNAYTGNQIHREPLDSTVVNRLENILKENEHVSARDRGYISLVSGVSLEGARPSVELSSFVHNSPLRIEQNSGSSLQQLARGRSLSPPSGNYGLPSIIANNAQPGQQTGANFLSRNQVSSSYGTPN